MGRWTAVALSLLLLSAPFVARGTDTSSCEDKRVWQRSIVQSAVHRWFARDPNPGDLLHLIQAEQGIVACAGGSARPLRLHTTTLPRGLGADQFGAILLANELEWNGLIPRPEDGLAGEGFRVRVSPVAPEAAE
jgi:hypothetical protein